MNKLVFITNKFFGFNLVLVFVFRNLEFSQVFLIFGKLKTVLSPFSL